MATIEIWKGVKGYEDLYEVSSLGRVRSLPRVCRKLEGREMKNYIYGGKILKPYPNHKGYLMVRVYRNRVSKDYPVHRLVATAFIPNPDNLPQVNHKDEVKNNNRLENLEWCTNQYNRVYGTNRDRHKKPVAQYGMDGTLIATYPSRREAGKAVGIHGECISAAVLGKTPRAAGYIWKNL